MEDKQYIVVDERGWPLVICATKVIAAREVGRLALESLGGVRPDAFAIRECLVVAS